jgi:hypothetical protein
VYPFNAAFIRAALLFTVLSVPACIFVGTRKIE